MMPWGLRLHSFFAWRYVFIMRFRRAGAAGGGLLLLAVPVFLFFLRSPVLILTDGPFDALYGAARARRARIEASLRLFRRVKPVRAAETAGPDAILLMLEAASPRPGFVLFPWRYEESARRYADRFPAVPVIVLGAPVSEGEDASGGAEGSVPRYLATDTGIDFYRAGRCAAILAGAGAEGAAGNGGSAAGQGAGEGAAAELPAAAGDGILVFRQRPAPRGEREAFARGLRDGGIDSEPRYPDLSASVSGYRDLSVAVLAAKPADFLEQNLSVPVILFSWLDPAASSRETKVIFDDSPWAMAVRAVKMVKNGDSALRIPSAVHVFPKRIGGGETLRRLREAVRASLPE
ncbi:MAG: hypothetical protein LBS06_01440 [Treponema sp.]|jgi:hypothetical protein|nr:hypothetical protein [Treponema sp.]